MTKILTYDDFCNEEISFKKTLLSSILGLSLLGTPATSQIIQRKLDKSYANLPELKLPELYDSTSNKVEDLRMLKGEKLFFTKDSKYSEFSFEGFYKPIDDYIREVQFEYNLDLTGTSRFSSIVPLKAPDSVSIIEISELSLHQTSGDVNNLRGEYFEVMDVFYKQTPGTTYSTSGITLIVYYLKLKRLSNNETLYFLYNTNIYDESLYNTNIYEKYSSCFPFIVVGFYEKIKNFFVGSKINIVKSDIFHKLIISSKKKNFTVDRFHFSDDYKLTRNYKLPDSSIWTCKDLLIDENDKLLKILLEESSGIQIAIPVEEIFKGLLSADNQKLKELLK